MQVSDFESAEQAYSGAIARLAVSQRHALKDEDQQSKQDTTGAPGFIDSLQRQICRLVQQRRHNDELVRALVGLGRSLCGRGHFDKARKHFEEALVYNSDLFEIRTCLALLALAEGRAQEAAAACQAVLAAHEGYSPARLGMALATLDRGCLVEASKLLALAVGEAAPASPSQFLRAVLLMTLGQKQEAANLLEHGLAKTGPHADLLYELGHCLTHLDNRSAAAHFGEAIRLAPAMALPRFAQAQLLLRKLRDLPLESRPYAKVADLLAEGFDCLASHEAPEGKTRWNTLLERTLREAYHHRLAPDAQSAAVDRE